MQDVLSKYFNYFTISLATVLFYSEVTNLCNNDRNYEYNCDWFRWLMVYELAFCHTHFLG